MFPDITHSFGITGSGSHKPYGDEEAKHVFAHARGAGYYSMAKAILVLFWFKCCHSTLL